MCLKDRIKKLAINQGISLSTLESILGFGNATIVKWDKSIPSADKLLKVSNFFGVSMDYLMTGKENYNSSLYNLSTYSMNSVERVKMLCKERKIPIPKLEKELGYSNGYIGQLRKGVFPGDRLIEIATYFNVSVDFLMTGKEADKVNKNYLNDETVETVQIALKIFHNKELRVLFDTAKDAQPEDILTVHSMLLALKRKERGNIDN